MNVLLVVGIIILLGSIGGKIFQKLKLPQVMGYIMIGLFLGTSFHGILSGPLMDSFRPIISLALGVIGFMIGAEIRFDRFKKYSRSIYMILFAEAMLTFFLVCGVTVMITGKLYIGLILGALASATAPAATYNVLGEYKARGPVTMTTLSIVALDDALALIIYGFASAFARSLIAGGGTSLGRMITVPLMEIAVSVIAGAVAGYVLYRIASRTRDKEKILPFTFGTIIFIVGLALYFKVDPILASMVLGAVASNMQHSESPEMFDVIKRFSSPICILFFVLVGAKLDARILLKGSVVIVAVAYILSRSVGKVAGAYIGGKVARAKDTVTKYLGFCLFDQAGVAVGLAIATFHMFSQLGGEASAAGLMIINIITATTFLLQLVAPPMIKLGIAKADEMNRDIHEDDIIEGYLVGDVMDEDFFTLRENNNLHQIIDIMKSGEGYNFPVLGMDGKFLGVISMGEIRDTFYEEQMDLLVLAGDIVREVDTVVYAGQTLKGAMDTFARKNLDYVPVLENDESRRLVGQLEYRKIKERVTKELVLRQQEIEM